MVDMLRPDYGQAWASEGEKLAPAQDKVAMGWVQEMMPFQYENFLQARQDEALLYLLQKGVPEYSATQEYTANKSIVQYQGNLYLSTATVTGVLPTVVASWRKLSPAMAANGSVSVAGGGTGATTAAQARANLGLGDASTATLPTSTGVVIKGSGDALISRLLTGTSGDIVITNPDGVAGNINVGVGSNVVKSNQDSQWTSRGGITLPKGSTGERGAETVGKIRFNTELKKYEGFDGTSWNALGTSSEVEVSTFSGDGVTTVFTLTSPAFSEASVDVYIGGIWQNKGTYSVSGAQITFSEAPTPGTENLQVVSRRVVDLGLARASQISLEDSSNLITATTVEGAIREIVETSGTITASAEWGSVPSHSNPKLDLQAQALANRAELIKNAPLQYSTKSDALAAIAAMGDGQLVDCLDVQERYKVQAGSLVFVRNISSKKMAREAIVLSVGSGGAFATVADALDYVNERIAPNRQKSKRVTIRLQPGFVMAEQVLVYNGTDLSFVTIEAADAVVYVNPVAITQSLDEKDLLIPLFGAQDGSKLPVVGAQFEYMAGNTVGDGVALTYGSEGTINPACGVRKCRQGIYVGYGSKVMCHPRGVGRGDGGGSAGNVWGCDFSDCTNYTLQVSHESVASLPRSKFNGNTHNAAAVLVIWGSQANIYQSQVKGAASVAVLARDGGRIIAREADVSGAGMHGFQAYHAGYIDARYYSTSFAGAGGCSGAGGDGISVDTGGIVEAAGMNAQNCGTMAVRCSGGGTVVFDGGNGSGSARGLYAGGASTISAPAAKLNNCPGRAIQVTGASRINFAAGEALNSGGDYAVGITNASIGDLTTSKISGSALPLSVFDAATATITGATLTTTSTNSVALTAARNSRVSGATGTVLNTVQAQKITIIGGSFVYLVGAGATAANIAPATLDPAGIYFNT